MSQKNNGNTGYQQQNVQQSGPQNVQQNGPQNGPKKKSGCGGCLSKLLCFFFGAIFGVVSLVGSIVGVGYYAYKKVTPGWIEEKFNIKIGFLDNGEIDLKNMTISQIIGEVTGLVNNYPNMSLDEIEQTYGLKLPADIKAKLPAAASTIKIGKLMDGTGVTELLEKTNFSYVFDLMPGVVGESLVNALKDKSLNLAIKGDIGALLDGVKLGALTNATVNPDTGNYDPADPLNPTITEGLNNLDVGEVFKSMSGSGDFMGVFGTALEQVKLNSLLTGLDSLTKNKTFGDLLVKGTDGSTTINFESVLADAYLGDFMKFERGACRVSTDATHVHDKNCTFDWFVEGSSVAPIPSRVDSVNETLANLNLSTVMNGGMNIDTILGDLYLGDVMKYVRGDCTQEGAGHTHTATCKYIWYKAGTDVSTATQADRIATMDETLANISLESVMSGDFQLNSAFEGLYLGDVMGYTKGNLKPNTVDEYEWTDKDGAVLTGTNLVLANLTLSSLIDGTFNPDDILNDMKVGDALGYYYDEASGKWFETQGGIEASGFIGAIADVKILDLPNRINTFKIGEVLGHHVDNGVWYTKDNQKLTGIEAIIADFTLENFSTSITTVTIGSVMGLEKCTEQGSNFGKWGRYENNVFVPAEGIEAALADITVGNLNGTELQRVVNGLTIGEVITDLPDTGIMGALKDTKISDLSTKIDDLELAVVLNLVRDPSNPSGEWGTVENGVFKPASGLLQAFAGLKIGGLTGDALQSKINGLTLGDVIADLPDTGIMGSLKDTQIGNLSTAINDIQLAVVFGVVRDPADTVNGQWGTMVDGVFTPSSGIVQAFAGLSIGQLNGDTMTDTVNNMKLGDLFTVGDTGIFALLDDPASVTVAGLPDAMSSAVTNATMQKMMDAKLVTITGSTDKLDTLMPGWRNKPISEFLDGLIGIINSLPTVPTQP